MKTKRLMIVVVTALVLAVALVSSAYGRPDPTTGATAFEAGVIVVRVPSDGPAAEGEAAGFDWVDAATGAGVALGAVALAAGTVYVVRQRASHSPLASH